MSDLKTLTATIQHNCHISDAQFAGQYTLCVFLLKMREYYRWEKGIPLSHPLPRKPLGDWLTAREAFWDELDRQTFAPLPFAGQSYDPFDTAAINQHLIPQGYVYSGGIGVYHKPYFFLGRLEKSETQGDITLLVSAEELARDLVAPPAMLLDDTVFIRKESLRRVIWERIEEWRYKKRQDTPMARALACYQKNRSTEDMETILDLFTANELEAVLLHEAGEAQAGQLLGQAWEELLDTLPRSRAELLARAVRDHLADCLSTLPTLVETENTPSLHFYFANFNGMRRELFPEALEAYQGWVDSGNLMPLKRLYQSGQQRWQALAQEMLKLHRQHTTNLAEAIESLCHVGP